MASVRTLERGLSGLSQVIGGLGYHDVRYAAETFESRPIRKPMPNGRDGEPPSISAILDRHGTRSYCGAPSVYHPFHSCSAGCTDLHSPERKQ